MGPRAAFVSFRFGATDGVSVVARTWMAVFEELGFEVMTVTGEATAATPYPSIVVPGLGLDGDRDAAAIEGPLRSALADADLVVVENLLTIPMNLAASRAASAVLGGRPTLVHHHDPPWHRERFAHVTELPATDPAWRHVSINHLLRAELADHSIDSTVIYNAFAEPPPRTAAERAALRATVRGALDIDGDELVVAHPVRAIERKNVPAAVSLCEQLGATYWLLGPAEEGYEDELRRLLDRATCRIVHHPWHDIEGICAAADHITFPSTWEGFGNPPIEAALHRRTVSVGTYPVAGELRALGFDWFAHDDVDGIAAALAAPDSPEVSASLDRNQEVARHWFSLGGLRDSLRDLLDEAGWLP